MDNKYFYRHCQKNPRGNCKNSTDQCGIQFKYMMGSDTTAIDAFLKNINYLSCQLLSSNHLDANANDKTLETMNSCVGNELLHAVIVLLGVIIILLIMPNVTYFVVQRYKRQTVPQVRGL